MRQTISEFFNGFRQGNTQGPNRTRILLAVLMGVLLLVVLVRSGLGIYHGYEQSMQNEIEAQMNRYNNMSRIMADAENYQQEHNTLVQFERDYIDDRLIHASSLSLAEAQFQNLINELAGESNLDVRSVRILSRTTHGDITNLKIGINCRGQIEAIKNFLHKASNHEKFIFIDEMEIRIISQREQRFFSFNAQLIAWTKS